MKISDIHYAERTYCMCVFCILYGRDSATIIISPTRHIAGLAGGRGEGPTLLRAHLAGGLR